MNHKNCVVPVPPPNRHCQTVPEAELQLETPRFIIRLRIRGTKCRLLGPELPELRSLLNAPGMGAGCLVMELERAGKIYRKRRLRSEGVVYFCSGFRQSTRHARVVNPVFSALLRKLSAEALICDAFEDTRLHGSQTVTRGHETESPRIRSIRQQQQS